MDMGTGSRREFLVKSAKTATLGLVAAAGCSWPRGADFESSAVQGIPGAAPRTIDPQATLRLGLIGCGSRMQYCTPLLYKNRGIEIVALAEPQKENIERTVALIDPRQESKPEIYPGQEGYKSILARDDIDAVLVATPCFLHTPMYIECFQAGKHFYGEKPMSITVDEAKLLRATARKNPEVIAQIGFQRRGTALYQEGINRVRQGQIGEPVDVRAAWNNGMGPLGMPWEGKRVWLGRRELSGDWMLEQACHAWDVLNWMAGTLPVAARGRGRQDLFTEHDPQRDVTDVYFAHLEYPSFYVDFEHSWIAPAHDQGRFFGIFEKAAGLKGGIVLNEGKLFWRDPNKQPTQYGSPFGDPYWTEQSLAAFVRSLRQGTPVVSGIEEGYNASLVGIMVRTAVYEQRRVEMNEIA